MTNKAACNKDEQQQEVNPAITVASHTQEEGSDTIILRANGHQFKIVSNKDGLSVGYTEGQAESDETPEYSDLGSLEWSEDEAA